MSIAHLVHTWVFLIRESKRLHQHIENVIDINAWAEECYCSNLIGSSKFLTSKADSWRKSGYDTRGYIFSKIHCTRSEQSMIYLSVPADRNCRFYYRIFLWGKTPRTVYIERWILPHERFDVSDVLLRLENDEFRLSSGCHQVILREKRFMAIYQVHLRSQ